MSPLPSLLPQQPFSHLLLPLVPSPLVLFPHAPLLLQMHSLLPLVLREPRIRLPLWPLARLLALLPLRTLLPPPRTPLLPRRFPWVSVYCSLSESLLPHSLLLSSVSLHLYGLLILYYLSSPLFSPPIASPSSHSLCLQRHGGSFLRRVRDRGPVHCRPQHHSPTRLPLLQRRPDHSS